MSQQLVNSLFIYAFFFLFWSSHFGVCKKYLWKNTHPIEVRLKVWIWIAITIHQLAEWWWWWWWCTCTCTHLHIFNRKVSSIKFVQFSTDFSTKTMFVRSFVYNLHLLYTAFGIVNWILSTFNDIDETKSGATLLCVCCCVLTMDNDEINDDGRWYCRRGKML